MITIKTPNITAATDRERLTQMQSYLYQMAQQLQWAFSTIENGGNAAVNTLDRTSGQAISAEKSPTGTFNSIKSLIIKSADIVNAYYEEISKRLESQYVAQSDFGTYKEEMSQTVSENSSEIERVFSNLQKIESDVSEIRDQTLAVTAYVKTGLLYYDDFGFPVYGLEIGQENTAEGVTTFNKYARFTSGKLSFYDNNDTEVAYFSDYKMYITNAHIIGALTHGGYETDTSDGIAFNWIGR